MWRVRRIEARGKAARPPLSFGMDALLRNGTTRTRARTYEIRRYVGDRGKSRHRKLEASRPFVTRTAYRKRSGALARWAKRATGITAAYQHIFPICPNIRPFRFRGGKIDPDSRSCCHLGDCAECLVFRRTGLPRLHGQRRHVLYRFRFGLSYRH